MTTVPAGFKRRIDVMISSTNRDLVPYRQKAFDAVHKHNFTCINQEKSSARDGEDAISFSLRLVDEAEVYVGIFGARYGFRPDDPDRNPEKMSITEMEYRRAMERGIPVLIFILEDASVPESDIEDDDARRRLSDLKRELKRRHIVAFVESVDGFELQVYQALNELKPALAELPADDPVKPETPLPPPPDFYADPAYTLTTQFVGRTRELGLLDGWEASDDAIMIVEAIGGMGKSALTWEWIQRKLRDGHDYDGVLWWSFYERGATMSAFVRHALAYITGSDPDEYKSARFEDNLKALVQHLRRGRYLLALDGLERVLVAYHRWDAAQMRDDRVIADAKDKHGVPDVSEAEKTVTDRAIRACTDPRDGAALRALLAIGSSKVVISSRLIPAALEDRHAGERARGVAHIHLNGLDLDDALTLTRALGVTVTDVSRFKRFTERYGAHSLLVKIIAGLALDFRRARGDFDRWYESKGRDINIADLDVKQAQTGILQFAFEGLDETRLTFLAQIAAFGDAVSYDTLTIFNPFGRREPTPVDPPDHWMEQMFLEMKDDEEEKQRIQAHIDSERGAYEAYLSAKHAYDAYLNSDQYEDDLDRFDDLLRDLEERGLLRYDRPTDEYDMHPVVRGYAFDRLDDAQRAPTFDRIRGYFEANTDEDIDAAQSLEDLTGTLAIYDALLGAGKRDQAAQFFANNLGDKMRYNLPVYYKTIEMLEPLWPGRKVKGLPDLRDPSNQSYVLTDLAAMYYLTGRTADALRLQALQLRLNLDNDNTPNLINGMHNYAISLRTNDQLALSARVLRAALALAEALNNAEEIAQSRLFLLGQMADTGSWDEVKALYAALREAPPREVYWQAVVEDYYAGSLVARGLDATQVLEHADTLSQQASRAMGLRNIASYRGEVALAAGHFDAAVEHFQRRVTMDRAAGAPHSGTMRAIALAHARAGRAAEAREIIEGDYADPDGDNLRIAETYLALGEHDKACTHALGAYRRAWADGPPYAWWWELERAKAVLDALGEPTPDMPPYVEGQEGHFPYEDEIRALVPSTL